MTHVAQDVLLDMDRCEHGRHHVDPCSECPDGMSSGNPHLRPGQVIGYGLDGVPIVVPPWHKRGYAAAWYPTVGISR